MKKPELLMPAGTLDKLKLAFLYGADAVYAGVPFLSLRARENDFNFDGLEKGVKHTRELGKKIYFTVNIFSRNLKIKTFNENLERLISYGADALIMSDPGLISIVKERFPNQEIHLSVQSNCMNWESVRFWQKVGISRIILSRELRLAEIKEIHTRVPDIELEAFVHGSICIAYSGRCLMSHYMSYRDANQGVCDNSCRYPFKVYEKQKDNQEFVIQDLRDPGQFYPIDEDENGTYIMNAKDLCAIDCLAELQDAGVCSFKVEGRTKSDFYAAFVAYQYRQAIDDLAVGRAFNPQRLKELEQISNRGYHRGFLKGDQGMHSQNYDSDNRSLHSPYVGRIDASGPELVLLEVKGQIKTGQELSVLTPGGMTSTTVLGLTHPNGKSVDVLNPGMGLCEVSLSMLVPENSFLMRL